MSDGQKIDIALACRRIEVAAARIAAEVTRVASEPEMAVILIALERIDSARRYAFKDLLR